VIAISAFLLVSADFPTLDHVKASTQVFNSVQKQVQVVEDLIVRLIGSRSTEFKVDVDSSIGPPDKDTFKVQPILTDVSSDYSRSFFCYV